MRMVIRDPLAGSLHFPWKNAAFLIELATVIACTFTAISPLRSGVDLSLDSVNFVVAAQNLIEHGRFFVFSNWPSHSLLPVEEPFTDFPPGYALYLVPFLLIFKEPYLAATVAHAITIAALFGSIFSLFRTLHWPILLRIAGYLIVSVLTTFPIIYTHYWTEPFFIACTLATGTAMIRRTHREDRRNWYWAAGFAFMASSLKYIGVFNLIWFAIPIMHATAGRVQRTLLALTACTAPVLLWFSRNLLTHGWVSHSHLAHVHGSEYTLARPFYFLIHELLRINERLWPSFVVLLFAVVLTLFPFARMKGRWMQRLATPHGLLTLAALTHFWGLWALSLVTSFSLLDDRLLSPSISLAMVVVLNGIHVSVKERTRPIQRMAVLGPFLFLLVAHHTTRPPSPFNSRNFSPPPEAAAWERIKDAGTLDEASHFYSDKDLRHQLYARIPQRIIWDGKYLSDARSIDALLQIGSRPFFVLHHFTDEARVMEQALDGCRTPLKRTTYPEAGLVVYAIPR